MAITKGKAAPAQPRGVPPARTARTAPAPAPSRNLQAAPAAVRGVSLKPSDATQGGLIDDVNVNIIDAGFFLTDYEGKSDVAAPALIVQYETVPADGSDPVQFDQIYSAGSSTYFTPSEDNKMLLPVGDKTGINNSTNCFQFLSSLVDCGFPEDAIGDDISVIVGIAGHVRRVAQPKRSGLLRQRDGEEQREKSTLLFDTITALPEGLTGTTTKAAAPRTTAPAPASRTAAPRSSAAVAGKANGAARTAPAPAPAPAAEAESDVDTMTTEVLLEVLPAGEPVEKRSVPAKMFQRLTAKVKAGEIDTRTKTAITARVNQEEFLESLSAAGLIEYDGAVITVVAAE